MHRLACDGLKGLPDSVTEIWPLATVQLCVVHLVRASLRYASKAHWGPITKALRIVYTAPTIEAAQTRFDEFEAAWGQRYPVIIKLWRSAWEQFTPFLAFPPEGTSHRLHDERGRVTQRNGSWPRHPSARALPWRAGRTQGALPGDSQPTAQPGLTSPARPPDGRKRSTRSPSTTASGSPETRRRSPACDTFRDAKWRGTPGAEGGW